MKCIHLQREPDQEQADIKKPNTGEVLATLCTAQCLNVWQNDPHPNPLDSQAYHIFRSIDPDLPKNQWLRLTEKPIPTTSYRDKTAMPGAVYYLYVITVNGLGFESDPSEVIRVGDEDEPIDLIM